MFNKLRLMPPILAVFVFMGLFAVSAFAVKPDKPGGGGKPPAEKEDPVEVVYVDASIATADQASFDCPFYSGVETHVQTLPNVRT